MEFTKAGKPVRYVRCSRCGFGRQLNGSRPLKSSLCQPCVAALTLTERQEWKVTPADIERAEARLGMGQIRGGLVSPQYLAMSA